MSDATETARNAYAAEMGVPVALLPGDDPDEWRAKAEALLAWRGPQQPATPVAPNAHGLGRVGVPVVSSKGQVTDAELQGMSPSEINAARHDGRLDSLLGR